MLQIFNIALTKTDRRRPITLRATPDVVIDARVELGSARVQPDVLRGVLFVKED